MKQIIKLTASLVICYCAAFFGMLLGGDASSEWYSSLTKPFFMPPGWLFGPVWTVLYGMMGISLYLIWRNGLDNKPAKRAVIIFLIQLLLNAIWSPVFFGLEMPGFALVVIIILWLLILLTAVVFGRISKLAARLLVPYLMWVTFATVLNCAIVYLN